MAVTIYRSTDASAPALGNTAGSFIALLDAILVNGYGALASQGWTKPLTGTNLAAYKQPAGSNSFYLRVDDTSTTNAQVRGYETLTDVTVPTGTNPFPTTAQVALGSGLYVYKANGLARPWVAIGNGKLFHLFINPQNDTNNYVTALSFGDVKTLKSGDAYHTICAASTTSSNTFSPTVVGTYNNNTGLNFSAQAGIYMARTNAQTGTAITLAKLLDAPCWIAGASGYAGITTGLAFPNSADSEIYLSPAHLMESATSIYRGTIPGLWWPAHSQVQMAATSGDTITGNGALSTRSFEAVRIASGVIFIETTNTWDV